MQKSVRYNEGHALFLSAVARKEGTKRGYLSKKTAENSRWHEKFFALYQNILFYFENEQSARPAGIYLLEGCTCERAPAPKMSTTGKEALEKQVRGVFMRAGDVNSPNYQRLISPALNVHSLVDYHTLTQHLHKLLVICWATFQFLEHLLFTDFSSLLVAYYTPSSD